MIQASDAAAQIPWSARAQAGAVLVVATLAILPVAWLGVRRLVPARNVVFARWGFSHVLLGVAAVVLAGAALYAFGPRPGQDLLADLVRSAGAQLAAVALAAAWAVRLDPAGWRALGLWPGGHLRAVAAGLLLYLTCLPAILGTILVWVWFLRWSGIGYAPQDVALQFAALPPGERLVPVLIGTALIPLCEEVLFRAFLQPLLVQNVREVAGVGLTALLFAALHGVGALLPIFALACVLGAIMLRTQRLTAVWAVHALHNGLMFLLLYAFPDLVHLGDGP